MRKLKISYHAHVFHDRVLLSKHDQIDDEQGERWFVHAAEQERKQRPNGCHVTQRQNLPTVTQLQEEAQEIIAQRRASAEEEWAGSDDEQHGEDAQGEGEGGDELGDLLHKKGGVGPVLKAAPNAANVFKTDADEQGKGKKRKTKAGMEPDLPMLESGSSEAVDPELEEVARKHAELTNVKTSGTMAIWSQLRVNKALEPNFDGRLLTAVGASEIPGLKAGSTTAAQGGVM